MRAQTSIVNFKPTVTSAGRTFSIVPVSSSLRLNWHSPLGKVKLGSVSKILIPAIVKGSAGYESPIFKLPTLPPPGDILNKDCGFGLLLVVKARP